jgi:AcrR family transcriptional regulator
MKGVRAIKKERTRTELAQKALALFLERGFHETTVDEIATAVDVSKRTFFRYFPTKESVVFVHNGDRVAKFREALAPDGNATAWDLVRRAILEMAREFEENHVQLATQRALIDRTPALLAYERELDRQWEDAIAEALLDGATDASSRRRARVLAGATMGATRGALQQWFEAAPGGDLVARGLETLAWLENGFRAP